jgi:predicted neutral ceramidase superfamily lipid hydrolase
MSEELKYQGYMSAAFRQFIIKILVFTIIITVIAAFLFLTILKTWYVASYPYQIILIATVTTIGHLLVIKSSLENARRFATAFLASVTLKLMIYLTFILVYLLIDHSQTIPFVLTFITLYILFTTFEVIEVLNFVKKK